MAIGKIYIGESNKEKVLKDYIKNNSVKKTYIIGEPLELDSDHEVIKFSDVIMYKYFYRLLQEINGDCLVVLNECLRKKNRYDLSYNCIKRYLLQTKHRIVFNYFPIIEKEEDFMILYDMIQENPFLKDAYRYVTHFENVILNKAVFEVTRTDVEVTPEQVEQYKQEKEKVIGQVKKDADIIPRRLLKFSEKIKPKGYDSMKKIKPIMNVVVSQLPVDHYYYGQLENFRKELENVSKRISTNNSSGSKQE